MLHIQTDKTKCTVLDIAPKLAFGTETQDIDKKTGLPKWVAQAVFTDRETGTTSGPHKITVVAQSAPVADGTADIAGLRVGFLQDGRAYFQADAIRQARPIAPESK